MHLISKNKLFYLIVIVTLFGVASLFLFPMKTSLLPSTLFYYGQNIPIEQASQFQQVIVEPDNIAQHEIDSLKEKGVKLYAYLSIGEVGQYRSWADKIDRQWVLGSNEYWKSTVMDMSNPEWRQFIIEQLATELWKKGFQGFFLDTMDSYQNFTETADEKLAQQQGIIQLAKVLNNKFDGVSLLFNRGFEVIDRVADLTDGIVAESLFVGWDAKNARYRDVSPADHQWLLNKLTAIRNKHQLPIIVLDYLPSQEKAKAKVIAKKIQSLGFVPWVSTVELNQIGEGLR